MCSPSPSAPAYPSPTQGNLIAADWTGSTYRPGYAILVDSPGAAVVLVARGTGKLHDVLTDLACAAVPHRDGGYAHGGMLEAAKRLREDVIAPVRDALVNRPGFSLVLCGHSLGGGVATLLADLLGPEIEVAGRQVPVRCFSYAPPAVLSIELVRCQRWPGFGFVLAAVLLCSLARPG